MIKVKVVRPSPSSIKFLWLQMQILLRRLGSVGLQPTSQDMASGKRDCEEDERLREYAKLFRMQSMVKLRV